MTKAYIYWLHLPEHTDMKSEGYIGVANNHNKRFNDHKREASNGGHDNPHLQAAFQKYGDRIVKHVVWLGEEVDCYGNEEILRPEPNIGWNLCQGGGKTPRLMGKDNPATRPDILEKIMRTSFKEGNIPWNKGLTKEDPRVAQNALGISIGNKGKPKSEAHKQSMRGPRGPYKQRKEVSRGC